MIELNQIPCVRVSLTGTYEPHPSNAMRNNYASSLVQLATLYHNQSYIVHVPTTLIEDPVAIDQTCKFIPKSTVQ